MGLVALGFELEGAVVDVEVLAEAVAEPVEDFAGAAVGEAVGVDDDVGGQHRDAAGDGPGVQIVDVGDTVDVDDVLADLVEVDAAGGVASRRTSTTSRSSENALGMIMTKMSREAIESARV